MILADTSILVGDTAIAGEEAVAISVVSLAELQVGVLLAGTGALKARRLSRMTLISQTVRLLPVDAQVADAYATLRATVDRQPTNDLWIAATAVAHGLELVTADEQQARLPGVAAHLIRR